MLEIFSLIFWVGIVIGFFYFGYRHDYRRNPKEFKRTIMGMPISLFSVMNGIPFVSDWVGKWIRDAERED
ncbi:MAG: hypothetical protein ACJA1A_001142 [Saprospiraceae bacterium]|jgi:hypothetical protein|tara:strand:- start:2318 stop:2527 length:210 start_codon:yes stop_codon:yes gene_type:complete